MFIELGEEEPPAPPPPPHVVPWAGPDQQHQGPLEGGASIGTLNLNHHISITLQKVFGFGLKNYQCLLGHEKIIRNALGQEPPEQRREAEGLPVGGHRTHRAARCCRFRMRRDK